MNILVFGHSGQVATELRALDGADIHIAALARADVDLTDPAACDAAIEAHAPDAVINAAAYTAVDKAESDVETADLINAQAPAAMARVCATRDIPFCKRHSEMSPVAQSRSVTKGAGGSAA